MRPEGYTTPGGIVVERTLSKIPYQRGLEAVLHKLDTQRGIYLSSGYEYPGRYSRWDIAAIAPPLELLAKDRAVELRPLNERGKAFNVMLEPVLAEHPHWEWFRNDEGTLHGVLKPLEGMFTEEERSKQPSAFSVIRALIEEFRHPLAARLALVGAFGFDLLFRFDPIKLKLPRKDVCDLRLLLCDEIYFMDRKREQIERYQFEFTRGEITTRGLKRT